MKIDIDREKFKQIITAQSVVLVKFYADWCGPCKTLTPIVNQKLRETNVANCNFAYLEINVDTSPEVASYMKVQSIPTMISFVRGQKMDVVAGLESKALLAFFSKLQRHIQDNRGAN